VDEFAFNPKDYQRVFLPALLSEAFSISRNEARRIVEQRGLRIDGTTFAGLDCAVIDIDGRVGQIGKKRFVRPVYQ
jgi:tyrosyl-tRNA synthetase